MGQVMPAHLQPEVYDGYIHLPVVVNVLSEQHHVEVCSRLWYYVLPRIINSRPPASAKGFSRRAR